MSSNKATSGEPVTVIIPTFNRRELLGRAIDSVLRQTWRDFELLIVDDGSADGTAEMVASYGKQVRYLWQGNCGVSAARNTGIKAARHDLLAFLDSDDTFAPDKLEIQVQAMMNRPDCLVSHTDEIWQRRGQILRQKERNVREGGDIFARCLELCAVGISTAMLRRSLLAEIGLFDEDLPCCEDYDFWLRISVRHQFLLVSSPLTTKDGGRDDQLSLIHRIGMDRFRIASILKIIESGDLDHGQLRLARQELVRKCLIYGHGCLKHGRAAEGRHYLAIGTSYSQE